MVTASLATALLVISLPPALLFLLARRSKRSENVRNSSSSRNDIIQTKSICMSPTRPVVGMAARRTSPPLPVRSRLSSCCPSVAVAGYLLALCTAVAATAVIPSRTILGFCATGASSMPSRQLELAALKTARRRGPFTTTGTTMSRQSASTDGASQRCVFRFSFVYGEKRLQGLGTSGAWWCAKPGIGAPPLFTYRAANTYAPLFSASLLVCYVAVIAGSTQNSNKSRKNLPPRSAWYTVVAYIHTHIRS